MNRYFSFFRGGEHPHRVEVKGGFFALRTIMREKDAYPSRRRLCFVNTTTGDEMILSDYVRHIRPIGENGIACSMFFPQGDRNLRLYFFVDGILHVERGYLTDPYHLYYMLDGSLRCRCGHNTDHLVLSSEEFACYGFCGDIYYEDTFFWIPSQQTELIPRRYFTYDGVEALAPKQHAIAREIMLQTDMFLAESFTHPFMNEEKRQTLCKMTWEAHTATLEDVKALYEMEASEGNLSPTNAAQVGELIRAFEASEHVQVFTRYMELFFTVYEKVSRRKERLDSRTFDGDGAPSEGGAFSAQMHRHMYENMARIGARLVTRPDFAVLLEDYTRFEAAIMCVLQDVMCE